MEILIASVPHREQVVAEVWCEEELLGEVSQDAGELLLELHAKRDRTPWQVPLQELIDALQTAKVQLKGNPSTGT
jgi:hypothetical protein